MSSGSEYTVVVNDLDAAYAGTTGSPDAGVLRLSTAYVSSTLNWVPARPGETQLVMNSTLAKMSYNIPSNFYLTRTFRVTATNVAEGFDCHDIVLNLDGADVVTTVPAMIQAQNTYPAVGGAGAGPTLGKIYTVKTIDTESSKIQPPSFLPTITGASTVTLTWTSPVPAYLTRLFVNWTPVLPASVLGGLETSYVQPLVYYTEFGATPIVIPDTFIVGQQYLFKFTCEATATTLSMTQNATYTPAYIVSTDPRYPLPTINTPTGATTITHSWTAPAGLATTMTLTWSPSTTTPFITNYIVPGNGSLQSIAIPGFLPNKQYTFTYTFAPDNSGVYDKYIKVVGPYSVLYTPPLVSFSSPVTSSNVPSMQLAWSFSASPTGAPVFVQVGPSDPTSLAPTYTTTVPVGTSNLTVNGLVLGTPYIVNYIVEPDPTGVYGSSNAYYNNTIILNNPVITPSNFTSNGGTTVVLGWSNGIIPAMPGTVSWTTAPGGTGGGGGPVSFTSAQTSLTTSNYTFVIGQPYNFTFRFAQTQFQTHYPATYQLTYVPKYLPHPAITINTPQSLGDGTAVQLSWNQGGIVSSGSVTYGTVGSINATTCNISNYQSNLSIAGLSLGSNYTFNYYFNPDISGIYAGTSGPYLNNPVYVPRGQPYVLPSDIQVSGGTTITLSWQLKMNVGGIAQNVNGVPVTVTWTPTTVSMGTGKTTTANQISITGFEANTATGYWFTLAYARGQSTIAYTTTYPSLNSLPYVPILATPPVPNIYVDPDPTLSHYTSASTANIVLRWTYTAIQPVLAAVSIISLNITTGDTTNIRVEPPLTSVSLDQLTMGLEYKFTLLFDPDITGTVLGTQALFPYVVPLKPDIHVYITPNLQQSGVANVTWTAFITPYDPTATIQRTLNLDTLVDILAIPPSNNKGATQVSVTGIRTLNADGSFAVCQVPKPGDPPLVPGIMYLFQLTFHARQNAPTTWQIISDAPYLSQ